MNRLILALTFCLLSTPVLRAEIEGQEFRIIEMEGEAGIIPQGQTQTSPAKEGISLTEGDRLITGKGGRIQAATKDGTIIELKEESYLKISQLRPTQTSFFLKVGKFLGKFAPKKYTQVQTMLRTPIAVAAVRGTELAMDVSEEEELQFGVVEGSVAVTKSETPVEEDAESVESPMAIEEISSEKPAESSEETKTAEEMVVESSQGVVIKREGRPERLNELPPLVRKQVAWFTPIREKVPQIKERWQMIPPSQRQQLRRQAFRERVNWKPPQKLMNRMPSPRQKMEQRRQKQPMKRPLQKDNRHPQKPPR